MKQRLINILTVLCLMFIGVSCSDDVPTPAVGPSRWDEKTVAVVLPMEKGLDAHWHRCLDMFSQNFERAFANQKTGIRLKFEYYDEMTVDLNDLAGQLAARDDIYAVIGGLYSSDAAILATRLTIAGKPFFTLATSEELVRAYATTGNLWAMTETDITQCEVLLSKVINYGGHSVALLVRDNDIYGKTFADWFAFQTKELGLDNKGTYAYDESSIDEMTRQAKQSGAEYVICVPSEIDEIEPMLHNYNITPLAAETAPRLLFSDTAYGADVMTLLGNKAEGIEGVAFGADPESGFDISYHTYYGIEPTTGEAQLYDTAMLLGYAAWYQNLNPDVTTRNALRHIVSGRELNMGSWTGEDMSLVVDALGRGGSPDVRGASGHLNFDSKLYTNVLATTYYNYKIYNGRYIILDYNTSDGGNRTDATLAGWNWKASHMQDFDDTSNIQYPAQTGNWALLVATSTGWTNYRHQADVLAIYQQLKASGYDDHHIILIAEDDLATNPANPEPGVIRITPSGSNVRTDARIDYRLSDLNSTDIRAILTGERSDRLPEVIDADSGDNIFVYWSGHGVPGGMVWNDDNFGMTGGVLASIFRDMNNRRCYRKLLMMVEACFSGGVLSQCEGIPGMLFITAANGDETSKADIFNSTLNVWMTNRFTSTFIEQITANTAIAMRDLYYRLFINTVGSHVMVYNAPQYGNLYNADMSEFINFKQ